MRPLFDDGAENPSAVTRYYVLKLDRDGAPLLNIYGGKITTYRRLAEEATAMVGAALGRAGMAWTAGAALPGGDLGGLSLSDFEAEMGRRYPLLAGLPRLVRTHGAELAAMLDGARGPADLGEDYGAGLTAREISWMRRHEWAVSAEDLLWRRTKLGLHLDAAARDRLAAAFG